MPKATFPAKPYILTRPVEDFEYALLGEMPPRKKDYGPVFGLLVVVLAVSVTGGILFAVLSSLLGAA